jgi:hypothetical protein
MKRIKQSGAKEPEELEEDNEELFADIGQLLWFAAAAAAAVASVEVKSGFLFCCMVEL